MSRRLAAVLYRWRIAATAAILLGAVVLAPRANITNIDNDLSAWFAADDPVYQEYERFREEFGGTRTLIVAIEAPSRAALFSRDAFDYLARTTSDIERVQTVDRVNSLATATVIDTRAPDGGTEDLVVDVRPLFDDLDRLGPDVVGQRALDDELLAGDLVSSDGTVAAIVVFFDEARIDDIRAEVVDRIHAIVGDRLPAGFRAHFNGSLEITETYNRVTLDNQYKFTPPILLLTLIAIYALFRSWRRTLVVFGAVIVSVVWTLGLYDLAGFTYNVLSSMIVPLIVVLAIADDVHVVQHYDEARRAGSEEQAFISTVAHLFAPLLCASGTTALGMASLATSSVVAVREFGLGSAIGVMADFAISLVIVPTALGWLRPEAARPPHETWFKRPLERLARFSVRRAGLVLTCALGITVVAALGLTRLRVDTNHINFFSSSHPLGQSAAVIDGKLGGIYTFQLLLEGPAESLRQPDALRRADELEMRLRELPFVRKVTGLSDYVRRIHRELDEARSGQIPSDRATIAQELFLFSLADQGRAELARVAAPDFSKAQITVKMASMSSDLVFEEVQHAERLAAAAFSGTDIRPTVTGSGRLFATLDHYLVVSQISSFATAFLTVFAVIFLIFRSWRFGALAIAPNLFPVLAIFGVMGWLDISLNVATVMLASVALGIVDDDTIHFISRYRRETAAGRSTGDAIDLAITYEGRASLTTALINSCAFAVLGLSDYRPTAWFGGLLALTMGVAFLAEIFILPALIARLPKLFGSENVHARARFVS